ncbi:MAG: hypothetical protein N3F66_04595 [Spirochaetes bacterium]|nr:hypothetical protein [Spirochaetota bacterium]
MKKYIVYLLCIMTLLFLQCTSAKHISHKNLWRFDDPYINQTIVNAWENINKRRYEWAALDFTRLIQKNYVDYDILFGAGLAHFFMNDAKKALDYLTLAIEKNPKHFEAYYFRAKLFLRQNDTLNAKHDLGAIITMKYTEPLICGWYYNDNDIADNNALKTRQKEAQALLASIAND